MNSFSEFLEEVAKHLSSIKLKSDESYILLGGCKNGSMVISGNCSPLEFFELLCGLIQENPDMKEPIMALALKLFKEEVKSIPKVPINLNKVKS